MRFPRFTFLLVLVSAGAFAQAHLVKDLDTTPASFNTVNVNFKPTFTRIGENYAAFPVLKSGITSLWISDGTTAGTREVDPNTRSSESLPWAAADLNGKLIYVLMAPDKTQIRKYDPITTQTFLVKEFPAGLYMDVITSGDVITFGMATLTTTELWKTDGTEEGTVKFATIPTSNMVNLVGNDGGTYTYFTLTTNDYPYLNSLWRTDGTDEGTVRLIEGVAVFDPLFFELYVTGNDAYIGVQRSNPDREEFWKSDGTPEGTIKIATPTTQPVRFGSVKIGSNVLFASYSQLFSSDGTEEGTTFIGGDVFGHATEYKGEYYFIGGQFPDYHLAKSDGTSVETIVELGSGYIQSSSKFYHFGDKLLVALEADGTGSELGITDGTEEGTTLIKDINPGPESSSIIDFVPVGDKMLFTADDGEHGREIWVTDGTEEGTFMVIDTNPGTRGVQAASRGETNMVALGDDHLAYNSTWDNDAQVDNLWVTDGTAENTNKVFEGGFSFRYLGSLNGDAYYQSDLKIVKLSATTLEASTITDISDTGAESFGGFTYTKDSRIVNDKLIFNVIITGGPSDVYTGSELWVTDGTSEGTHILKDINPGSADSEVSPADETGITWNDKYYFTANDGVNGRELWSTDGTEEGTAMVADLAPGADYSNPNFFFEFNDKLFFVTDENEGKLKFWFTDGTEEGTQKSFEAFEDSYIGNAIKFKDEIYFNLVSDDDGQQLWKTDGTLEGTVMIKQFTTKTTGRFDNTRFVATEDYIFFGADDDVHGPELWKSDGSTEGTTVIDITPGAAGDFGTFSDGFDVKLVNDVVYFKSKVGLWRTAGTVELSEKISDDVIYSFKAVGDNVYFVPDSPDYGAELFVMPFTKFDQAVTLEEIGEQKVSEDVHTLSASATSELPVTFSASPSDHVLIDGTTITFLKAGEVTITASQAGNAGINAAEASQTIVVTEDVVSGLEDKLIAAVYPNPAKDKLFIQWSGNSASATVMDINGNRLISSSFVDKTELSINSLPSGFYILKLASGDKQIIKKIVKE